MQTKRLVAGRIFILGLVLIGLAAGGDFTTRAQAQPPCYTYDNSRVSWVAPIGWTCAYSGNYCIECVEGGTACWGDESRIRCGPYQQMP